MKVINNSIICCFFVLVFVLSCKSTLEFTPLSSINITNAIINGKAAKFGNNSLEIGNNNSVKFSLIAGQNNLNIYPPDDVSHPYYTKSLNSLGGEIYSLFLTGESSNVEGLLVKDILPIHQDSTAGVRVINLSPDSHTLNITLTSNGSISPINNLPYKGYTDFINYPAKSRNANYTVQVKNAVNDLVLSSYTLVTPRFANVTLVIRGLIDSNSGIGITRVNNDRP